MTKKRRCEDSSEIENFINNSICTRTFFEAKLKELFKND